MTDNNESNPSSSGPLLKVLAVGQLARTADGGFDAERHELVAMKQHPQVEKAAGKAYKAHMKAIMAKGASKLTIGKRIRLTSDDNAYDVHVLADAVDDAEQRVFVFFAVTSGSFGKSHSVASLFRDAQAALYDTCGNGDASRAWAAGKDSLSRGFEGPASKLIDRYSSDALAAVSVRVESVKETMKESVQRAITNVEQLEEMEEKSEEFEAQAKRFQKNSSKVKRMFCQRYVTISIMIGIVVIAIVAYIIYLIAHKSS